MKFSGLILPVLSLASLIFAVVKIEAMRPRCGGGPASAHAAALGPVSSRPAEASDVDDAEHAIGQPAAAVLDRLGEPWGKRPESARVESWIWDVRRESDGGWGDRFLAVQVDLASSRVVGARVEPAR